MVIRTPSPSVDVEEIRVRKREAMTRFLGRTIAISEEDWQQPSLLPGWTRAHVATHVARGADALRNLVEGVATDREVVAYPTEKTLDIERGSERSALNLQIDLDLTTSQMNNAFSRLLPQDWAKSVRVHGFTLPVTVLPLVRLAEVELHHVDLGLGYLMTSIDPEVQKWILSWYIVRHEAHRTLPAVTLVDEHGPAGSIGDGSAATVTGMRSELLTWITGRGHARVVGADDITVPLM